MEPVTHVLAGACLARTGLNRRAAYTTAALAIAAEFPDIDTLWSLRGPVEGFQHHRGITHTFLGLPLEAGFLLLLFWLFHRWREHRARAKGAAFPAQDAPLRWGTLYLFLLFALLSHILLDYTNNYGVRPFFPFNSHWYAASIVFIFDPLLFLCLLAGLTMPAIFGLVGREVSGHREAFRGAGWARIALLAVVALWCLRAVEHHSALVLADENSLRAPGDVSQAGVSAPGLGSDTDADARPAPVVTRALLTPLRSLASPDPLSPFRWYTVTDFGPAYQLGTANTRNGAFAPGQILNKPAATPMLSAAERSPLGRVYMDWSPMPWITVEASGGASQGSRETAVSFHDPRFMGATFLNRGSEPPLTGSVVLDAEEHVLEESLGDRAER